MLELIKFRHFKVLQEAMLPLGQFTLIVGPNGSGKSTALQALQAVSTMDPALFPRVITAGLDRNAESVTEVVLRWRNPLPDWVTTARWSPAPPHIVPATPPC
jgi:predicted ATPase